MLASVQVRLLSIMLLIGHTATVVHAGLFDSVCNDIMDGQRKIDVFGIWQQLPGYRFLLISGEYMYNQELDIVQWGSAFHDRPTITLSNRSLVLDNWPLLPANYTNYTLDGAIVGESTNDWLVFRTDVRYAKRKAIYQNMQNSKTIHLPEFKATPLSTNDFQLVSSTMADTKYGIGPSDLTGTTKMCLFQVKKVDAANEASDYKKVDYKDRSGRCTKYDPIHRAFIDKDGKFMYAIMSGFTNVSIYQIGSNSLEEVMTIQFDQFFSCTTYIDIILLICVPMLLLTIVGVVAYLYLMQKSSPANDSLEAAMNTIRKRHAKDSPKRSPKGHTRDTSGAITETSSSVATTV